MHTLLFFSFFNIGGLAHISFDLNILRLPIFKIIQAVSVIRNKHLLQISKNALIFTQDNLSSFLSSSQEEEDMTRYGFAQS